LTKVGRLQWPPAREFGLQVGIIGDLTYSPDHIRYVKRIDQHRRLPSHFVKRASIRYQDWHAKLHRFQYGKRKTLPNRRESKKARALQKRNHMQAGHIAEPTNGSVFGRLRTRRLTSSPR
jgi:hypothetical protein